MIHDTDQTEAKQPEWRRLLTAAERTAMLNDIACVSLAAGARLFPDQPWSDMDVATWPDTARKSPVERLGYIEYLLPVLAQALTQIAHSPLTSAAVHTRAALPHRARRVTASAWMTHARRGQASRSLDETVTLLSVNTPENQAVRSFLAVLERDSSTIRQIADAEEEMEAADRAGRCASRLHQMRSELWWEGVMPKSGDWTRLPTQRDTLRPEYARLARERSRYRKDFCFDWSQPLLTLPPAETWRLYEVWCLLMVLQALREIGWESAPRKDFFAIREGRLTFSLAPGIRSRIVLRSPQGQSLSLTYNQIFAEGGESLSHMMQPDITLSDGESVWILDAKIQSVCRARRGRQRHQSDACLPRRHYQQPRHPKCCPGLVPLCRSRSGTKPGTDHLQAHV